MLGRNINHRQISVRLTFFYALIFSLALISLNAFVLYGARYFIVWQNDKELQEIISQVKYNIVHAKPYFFGLDFHIGHTGYDLFIRDEKQRNLASLLLLPERIKTENIYNKTKEVEVKEIHYAYRLEKFKASSQEYDILLVKNIERDQKFLEVTFFLMAVSDCLGVLSAIAAGFLISQKMLRPIKKITQAAEQISSHDLTQRIAETGTDDELNRLIQVFNSMLERLQTSFELKNRFISDASHELRTPIAVIKGYSNLLIRWGKEDEKVLAESLTAIQQESQSMALLLEKLLFLARNDSHRQKIEKEVFSLTDLTAEVIKESQILTDKKVFKTEHNAEALIFADKKMLKQMLRALIDNSIKFTDENGTIIINNYLAEEAVIIEVEDDGIGIPAEDLPNIFSRFYRVDEARSRETGGSGLGLSIVKTIVDLHGGRIEVESKLQQGTRFIITLPRLREVAKNEEKIFNR